MSTALKTHEDGDPDHFPHSPKKELSTELIIVVSLLLTFMAAGILRLSLNGHFTQYFTSQNHRFFPKSVYKPNPIINNCTSSVESSVKPDHLNLMHSMKDEELLWRASMVARREGYPFERVMKVAFMFLTRGPLPFSPLWDRFFRGHQGLYSVYVHTVPAYKLDVSEDSAFYGRQIPSEEVQWGSISLVNAERRLLANALLDFSNERFVLLSESCIPIFNFSIVYRYLTNSAQSFLDSYDEDNKDARGRYNSQMAPDINLEQWRKGAEWFELSRELAVSLVADTKYYSIFKRYCNKPPCFPDEHYIPTYLAMFHAPLLAKRSITWTDWSRGGVHPASFGQENIKPSFIHSMRSNGTACVYNSRPTSVCFLFARKFAPSALEPLLNLTSTALEF